MIVLTSPISASVQWLILFHAFSTGNLNQIYLPILFTSTWVAFWNVSTNTYVERDLGFDRLIKLLLYSWWNHSHKSNLIDAPWCNSQGRLPLNSLLFHILSHPTPLWHLSKSPYYHRETSPVRRSWSHSEYSVSRLFRVGCVICRGIDDNGKSNGFNRPNA